MCNKIKNDNRLINSKNDQYKYQKIYLRKLYCNLITFAVETSNYINNL